MNTCLNEKLIFKFDIFSLRLALKYNIADGRRIQRGTLFSISNFNECNGEDLDREHFKVNEHHIIEMNITLTK